MRSHERGRRSRAEVRERHTSGAGARVRRAALLWLLLAVRFPGGKVRLGLNGGELPLADEGETGLFMRAGWNDGATETFAFTEVDRQVSLGAQVSGAHWRRAADRLGVAPVVEGLSGAHHDYLAAGGADFLSATDGSVIAARATTGCACILSIEGG